MSDDLHKRGRALEDAFFNKQDEALLSKLRAKEDAERKKGAIASATGIRDSKILETLVAQGVGPDALTALVIAPIVLLAWRKGRVEPSERNAILRAVEGRGIQKGSASWSLVEAWLERRPDAGLRTSWEAYVKALKEKVTAAEFAALREDIVTRAREVAGAAGGFLGVASVSADEKQFIATLEALLA